MSSQQSVILRKQRVSWKPWDLGRFTLELVTGIRGIRSSKTLTATTESRKKSSWILVQKLRYCYFICSKKMAHNSPAVLDRNKEHVQGLSYWKKQTETENLSLVRTSFCTLNVETECFNLLVSSVQATLHSENPEAARNP